MTRNRNARIAGGAFLCYIAVGVLPAPNDNVGAVFTLLCCGSALVLAVTLYGITCEEDHDIAMLGLTCRVAEGVLGAVLVSTRLAVHSLGTSNALVVAASRWNVLVCATFFAVGSTMFSWLLLRGRMIPVALARLGVVASVLLVVGLPFQLAGILSGMITKLLWVPMAAFEVPLALWLLIKGIGPVPVSVAEVAPVQDTAHLAK